MSVPAADGKGESGLWWCGDLQDPQSFLTLEPLALPCQGLQEAAARCVLTPTLCPLLLQLLSKYDPQKEEELRGWIEGLTGLSIGPDFQKGLKDGIILCTDRKSVV